MRSAGLTTSDKVIGVSAIALAVGSFLPWFGFEHEISRDGVHYVLFGVVPLVIALAMLATVIANRFAKAAMRWRRAYLIAGAVAAALILAKLLIGDTVNLVIVQSVTLSRKFGIYLSAVSALGLVVGGLLKAQEPAG